MPYHGLVQEGLLVKLLLLVALLLAFRATRRFIGRRMEYILPFVVGFLLGLLLLPVAGMGGCPAVLLMAFPFATGAMFTAHTRQWVRNFTGRNNDGKDDDRRNG